MLDVTRLEEIAAANKPSLTELNLSGMTFDPAIPSGGDEANRLWFMYNIYNQIDWRYNNATQSYHRWQDNADGENFIEATDRLTGETLTFENVIILFASHRACTETAFDVDLLYMDRQPALLFRDGKMYPIFWTSKSGDYEKTSGKLRPIRFVDDIGNPFPLHPGQTWIHLVPLKTPYWETDDTRTLFSLLNHKKSGTGNWAIRFDKSFMLDDPTVCDAIRN
jgi:hypothetical protein